MADNRQSISFRVASNFEELQRAFAVRALVYIGEQKCPWLEEFDGNDFTATQVLGLVNGEPIATARIRWFHRFAKLERLAVRAEFRAHGYGHALLQYLISLCQYKGYNLVCLHAQERLASFYECYGFRISGQRFGFSDHYYLPMLASFDEMDAKLSELSDPLELNRPEGRWEETGILEKSNVRMNKAIESRQTSLEKFVPAYF